ncbi:retrovirus-related pol polyprotein from transposon TNT 1-94 [Tanacetum coccineum]
MLRLELLKVFVLSIGKLTFGLLPRYTSCNSRVNVNSLTVNHVPKKLHDTDPDSHLENLAYNFSFLSNFKIILGSWKYIVLDFNLARWRKTSRSSEKTFRISLTTGILLGDSISPDGFLPSIMLLLVIIVAVVIVVVTVVLVVVVGEGNPPMNTSMSFLEFGTIVGHKTANSLNLLMLGFQLVEIILFIVDSGCSKHMTGNLKLLSNFVEKFLGTVKFGNDQIALILGYGDLVQGNITIKRVYYVEGLNHNLFSVGQFCDADLEVAFRKSTCYIRDLKGNDLLTGSRGTDLYSITLQDTSTPNPICLMAKASSSQAWLWHRRLSHLNFDTINLLSKYDIVTGLPKLKFVKDHLCSSCELGKAKRKSFHTKTTPSSKRRLQLLHMDLCGPMRVESINGKKYVLVIVDDYSRYTWTHFLRSKDETPEVLIDFLRLV